MLRTDPRQRPLGLLLLATLAVTAGCDPRQPEAGPAGGPGDGAAVTVGFAQVGAESAWRTAETRSIRSEAEARGVNLKFSDAQQKQENQINALRSFVAQGVDAIILAPKVETGWTPVLREAQRAGIPVILVDRGVDADPSFYATLIASDFVEEGRMAGRWAVEALDGQGRVAEIQGTPGSAPANDRRTGFAEIIDQTPGVSIVASQTGNFTRSGGKEVMEAMLKTHGGAIDLVYAHNDDMALGAIQAIEEAGYTPGEDILVVSIDGTRPAFEAMAEGSLNATIECNPLLGPMAFDAVERAVRGETLPKRQVVNDRLFVRAQAAAELPNRKY